MKIRNLVQSIGKVLTLAATMAQLPAESAAKETPTGLEFISSRLRELAGERAAIARIMEQAPAPVLTQAGQRLGFHSRTFFTPDQPDSVVVDLGRSFPIDAVCLVPITVNTPIFSGGAYGFPRRFRIAFSRDPAFEESETVVSIEDEDFPNPGSFPVTFFTDRRTARFVKITSTLHAANLEHYIWALGELMVISDNRNVAAQAAVLIERAPSFPPAWSPANLTDSESTAAIPMIAETSPSNGWLADQLQPIPPEKWVAVDWKRSALVEEIRLIPARPTDMADTPGMGFPLKYRIEGKELIEGDWIPLHDAPKQADVRTSENMVVIPGINRALRSVRVVAEALPRRNNRTYFALAELQVYSRGTNVAAGGGVSASDSFADARFPRWAPEYLVDGHTSQYRLVEWMDYLRRMDEYAAGVRRMADLERRFDEHSALLQRRVLMFVGWGALFVLAVSGILIGRLQRRRLRETRLLREQISRDLHDDIGSNLGGIALISEINADRKDLPPDVLEDLREINQIAAASSESMRDIIWLAQAESATVRDLSLRMKGVADRLTRAMELEWREDIQGAETLAVSLQSRRHLILAFKEAVHNAVRHSEASRLRVEISCPNEARRFRFRVEDNGRGFVSDVGSPTGNGLRNLERRANRIKGSFEFFSPPAGGATIVFEAPLNCRDHEH